MQIVFISAFIALVLATHSSLPRRMIVFGDSCSSSDATWIATDYKWPPSRFYPSSRFSDDRIYPDYLSSKLDIPEVVNLAVGSSTTDSQAVISWTGVEKVKVLGIKQQIEMFGNNFEPHDLILLWGGSNDFFFDSYKQAKKAALRQFENLKRLLQNSKTSLGSSGREPVIIILNLLELELIPGVRSMLGAKSFRTIFNKQLYRKFQTLKPDERKRVLFIDVSALISKWSKDIKIESAVNVYAFYQTNGNETALEIRPLDQCMFYDEYHFTSERHAELAELIIQKYEMFNKRA